MTSAEKWNLIVDGYNRLYSKPEAQVQAEWEMYCTDLFEYKKILHEIDSQRHVTIGSGGAIIPDIILRTNGTDIFDIELKQYSLMFNETFETQLISYLSLTHLSVGMIVCSKIYLYYYEYLTKSINKNVIPFEVDNPDGIALMEMLTKDTFSADRIREYILEKKRHEKSVEEIRKSITADWIKETVRAKLLEQYSEAAVDDALIGCSFKFLSSTPPTAPISPIPPVPPQPLHPRHPVDELTVYVSSVVQQWCQTKMQEGEINFLQDLSTVPFKRFTTDDMDENLPYQNGLKSGWRSGHFYTYEVHIHKGKFRMQVAFSNKNAPEQIRQVFSQILQAVGKRPRNENWEWFCPFTTKNFSYNEKTTQDEIISVLEQQFTQIRASVRRMLEIIKA